MKKQQHADPQAGFAMSAHLLKMALFAIAVLLSICALPFTVVSTVLMWPVIYMTKIIEEGNVDDDTPG